MKVILAIDESVYSAEAVKVVAARAWPPGTTVRVFPVGDAEDDSDVELDASCVDKRSNL